jgi:hypothetical protein
MAMAKQWVVVLAPSPLPQSSQTNIVDLGIGIAEPRSIHKGGTDLGSVAHLNAVKTHGYAPPSLNNATTVLAGLR